MQGLAGAGPLLGIRLHEPREREDEQTVVAPSLLHQGVLVVTALHDPKGKDGNVALGLVEGPVQTHHLVDHAAERPRIGALVVPLPSADLRGKVVRRADDGVCACKRAVRLEDLGNAKIGQLCTRSAAGVPASSIGRGEKHHIRGLHVAMEDLGVQGVDVGQARCDVAAIGHDLGLRQAALAPRLALLVRPDPPVEVAERRKLQQQLQRRIGAGDDAEVEALEDRFVLLAEPLKQLGLRLGVLQAGLRDLRQGGPLQREDGGQVLLPLR
mmetsp:Transcript_109354/g.327045  ORF Transcript_109354/g.327045 Transcript_109354/m.327045 type:complete len:269 (+) Transcript_109354:1566-2372(+)